MGGDIVNQEPTIVHRHSSGEVFEAQDLEQAQKICPVLGRLSLVEAGMLLQLEQMGKKILDDLAEPEDAELVESDPFMIVQSEDMLIKTSDELPPTVAEAVITAEIETIDNDVASTTPELLGEQPAAELPNSADVIDVSDSPTVHDKPDTDPGILEQPPKKPQESQPESPSESITATKDILPTSEAVMEPTTPLHAENELSTPATILLTEVLGAVTADTQLVNEPEQPTISPKLSTELVAVTGTELEAPQQTIKEVVALSPIVKPYRARHLETPDNLVHLQNIERPKTKVRKKSKRAVNKSVVIATKKPTESGMVPPLVQDTLSTELTPVRTTSRQMEVRTEQPSAMIIERLGLITELTEPDVVPTAHLLIETIIERLAYVPDTPEQRQSAIDDCVEDFVELCDILGIDCSREEVEQIIEKFFNLRNAESSPEIPESELPNYALSDLGTHEGLAYFLKGSVSLATAGRTIHNALGQRALLDLAS